MAISFVSSSVTAFGPRTNTTITAPASIADNDLLILGIYTGAASEAPDPTPPAGFTQQGTTTDQTGDSVNAEWRVYTKKAASESGNYTCTHSSATTQAMMLVYRGVDTTTPMDVTATTNTGVSSTTTTATGLTTVTAGAMLVMMERSWSGSTAQTPPTGMTERVESVVMYAADEIIAAAGATGNRAHTNSNSGGDAGLWAVVLLALRPASGTNYTLAADAGSYSTTGAAATTRLGRVVTAATASYAVTGTAADLERGLAVAAAAGAYSLTGTTADLEHGWRVAADSATHTITGTAADLERGFLLDAAASSYLITGTAASLLADRNVFAAAGSYSVSGADAGLLHAWRIDAGSSTYLLTGSDATLAYVQPGAYLIAADAGSYALTGSDAGLLLGRKVDALAGSYALIGASAGLLHGYEVEAGAGSYTLVGASATLTYSGGPPPGSGDIERTTRMIVNLGTWMNRGGRA